MPSLLRKVSLFLVVSMLFFGVAAYAIDTSDYEWVGGDQKWGIDDDGNMVPLTTDSYQLGTTTLYPSGIVLNGQLKESWGSIVSPMTDADGYVYPTDSGGVYRLYDAGYLSLGAGTAVDTYILFDTDDDDWYVGRDDTDNDFAIGVGSTLGTDERISIVDNATATIVVIGDGVNAEDKQVTFDGNALDFYIGYDDSADDLVFGVDSTVGTKPCISIQNESTPLLYLHNGLDGFGAVDIDYGSADVTDHSFISDGGTTIIDGQITLGGATNQGEIISNETDDTVRVASDDADTILEVYTPFDTTGDATLKLSADLGDEEGEQWTITSTGATTDLVIACDDTSSGTPVTRLTVSDAGVVTTVGTVNLEIDNAANTSITDILNIQHFTSGTAAAGIGAGLTFDLENATGTEEEHASIDIVATTSTNGAEDSDVVINQMTAGTLAETLRIVSASAADASDYLQFTANTTETNGLVNVMVLKQATGTATDNSGMSISFQPEDATGAEEHASIDILQTTAARATNDTDIIFSQDVNGTMAERVRMDADGANLLLSGATPSMTIGDAGAEDTQIDFDGNTADFSFGLDDNVDSISLSLGTTLGTTEVFKADGTTMTVTDNLVASGTLTATGAIVANGAVTLGNAVTDITTLTGKIAGASPISFDGATANTVYTILAVADPTSTSKTVTLPSVTGSIALETVATSVLTAHTATAITVVPGTDVLYTYTVDTDDENCTLTFSAGGTAGDIATIIFITDPSGSGDEVMTFDGTLSDSEGTLTLANGASKRYTIRFISDGTIWNEISRTAVLG